MSIAIGGSMNYGWSPSIGAHYDSSDGISGVAGLYVSQLAPCRRAMVQELTLVQAVQCKAGDARLLTLHPSGHVPSLHGDHRCQSNTSEFLMLCTYSGWVPAPEVVAAIPAGGHVSRACLIPLRLGAAGLPRSGSL